MHDKTIKLYRTTTPDKPPDTLAEGELAAGIGENPARLWIGGPNGSTVIPINEPAEDAPSDAVYGRTDGQWVRAVAVAGDTMTGPLIVNADPTQALGVATKQYVDRHLPLTGGTLTGTLNMTTGTDNAYRFNNNIMAFGRGVNWYFGNAGNFTATGFNTTGVGNRALQALTTGSFNTALGVDALMRNTNGNSNTSLGNSTLANNVGGTGNVAVGSGALQVGTSPVGNAAVGMNALMNATGSNNVGMGFNAGQNLRDGDENIFIGYQAGQLQAGNGSNNTLIGSLRISTGLDNILAICTGNTLRLDCNFTRSNWLTLHNDVQVNGGAYLSDTMEVGRDPILALEVATKQYVDGSVGATIGDVGGLEFSAQSGVNFNIAAGAAVARDGSGLINLSAQTNVDLSALLDTGSVTNNTWYHCFAIDTNNFDNPRLLVSTSPTSPILPPGYPFGLSKLRRISSFFVDGTGNIRPMIQRGNTFLWSVPMVDVMDLYLAQDISTLITLSIPPIPLLAIISVRTQGIDQSWRISSPLMTDQALAVNPRVFDVQGAEVSANLQILTDTRQIRIRNQSGGSITTLNTHGWIDERGGGAAA